ncbi:sorbose reductase sou1 [Suillus discolor]|uniref:Sorbose reductase sou1 n=1 Tax=Suillus discolor TaxID=1912936 RepID=A0A9P7FDX8_9AGAM|nr:sorbose reductase sou1 [Suillus discolor]KAG2115372.1 sorbose reductase sou1 [Suillus discolor]
MLKSITSCSSLAILRRSHVSSIYRSGVRLASLHSTPAIKREGLGDFALTDRVAIVTGGNRGLGLEAALALSTAGSRVVYCLDLPEKPGEDWNVARQNLAKLEGAGRLEYVTNDVRDQKKLLQTVEEIATKEGRMDICVAAAGIAGAARPCLEYTEEELEEVYAVNLKGVFFSAQAAARQMHRFQTPGSIILLGSIAGSIALKHTPVLPYNTSKAAVIQMARVMACELAQNNIRVNSLSPGYIETPMTTAIISARPEYQAIWSEQSVMNRLGKPHELRGIITWLASDASSFCTGSNIVVDGGYTAW